MFPLWCSVKTYHWGNKGSSSLVAKLGVHAAQNFTINENEHYAELWMGTHPSGESTIGKDMRGNIDPSESMEGKDLIRMISAIPEYAGSTRHNKTFGPDLPYLFKVLSVGQPLSIQSHPDIELAIELHRKDPAHYPDENHKPEMAIALTPFHALCSFRPHEELAHLLCLFPSFDNLLGKETCDKYVKGNLDINGKNKLLREMFTKVMSSPMEKLVPVIKSLKDSLGTQSRSPSPPPNSSSPRSSPDKSHGSHDLNCSKGSSRSRSPADPILTDLHRALKLTIAYYPQDVGIIAMCFLNYIKLNPGEGMYLPPNEPHAYLRGDCIEVMAKSDNVIRAGFTPKFKDVDTLSTSVSFDPVPKKKIIITGSPLKKGPKEITRYEPGPKEFAVDRIEVKASTPSFPLGVRESGSILVVIKGKFKVDGLPIVGHPGSVFFIPALFPINLHVMQPDLLAFRSFTSL